MSAGIALVGFFVEGRRLIGPAEFEPGIFGFELVIEEPADQRRQQAGLEAAFVVQLVH